MTEDKPAKKYPVTTSKVAEMLGIHGVTQDLPMGTFVSHGDLPIANLPIAPTEPHVAKLEIGHNYAAPASAGLGDNAEAGNSGKQKLIKIAKAAAPYAAVFAAGLFLYYFFFTGVNFSALFNSTPKASTPKQTALQQLQSGDLTAYYQWIRGYYYDVSDTKILDPESDNSGNGLSNFQKYLLNLNPKSYDTLSLGHADSQTLASGLDPASGLPLTDAQKATVSKYIDMEVVMNRLTLSKLQHPETVAGAGVNSSSVNSFFNFQAATANQNQIAAPKTGADLIGGGISLNTEIPGRLEIPDLKINVPIIWTKDTNSFNKDLQTGVVHYPGTALPGQIGTAYISGHSSNYVWAKGDFNQIFSHLGDLADNTSFKITVVQSNGKDAIFHYVVTRRGEYSPTDQAQFANTGKSVVALSTCWPVNSTAKRFVVFGELTQTEK